MEGSGLTAYDYLRGWDALQTNTEDPTNSGSQEFSLAELSVKVLDGFKKSKAIEKIVPRDVSTCQEFLKHYDGGLGSDSFFEVEKTIIREFCSHFTTCWPCRARK